jgi:hypothetical protein
MDNAPIERESAVEIIGRAREDRQRMFGEESPFEDIWTGRLK